MIELARVPPPEPPHSPFRIPHSAFPIPHSLHSAGLDDPLHMQSPPREIAYGRKGDMPLPTVPERDPMSGRLDSACRLYQVGGPRSSMVIPAPAVPGFLREFGCSTQKPGRLAALRAARPVRGKHNKLPYAPPTGYAGGAPSCTTPPMSSSPPTA